MRRLWTVLRRLGPSWAGLGTWGRLGAVLGQLGPWAVLVASGAVLGPLGSVLGASLEPGLLRCRFGDPLARHCRLGLVFGPFGSMGPSWCVLEPSWSVLGPTWGHCMRGRIGRIANDQQSQSNQRTNLPSNQTNQPKTWTCAERSSLEQCTRDFVSSIFQNLIWFELTKFQFDKVCV